MSTQEYLLLTKDGANHLKTMLNVMGHDLTMQAGLNHTVVVPFTSWAMLPGGHFAHLVLAPGIEALLRVTDLLGQFTAAVASE